MLASTRDTIGIQYGAHNTKDHHAHAAPAPYQSTTSHPSNFRWQWILNVRGILYYSRPAPSREGYFETVYLLGVWVQCVMACVSERQRQKAPHVYCVLDTDDSSSPC